MTEGDFRGKMNQSQKIQYDGSTMGFLSVVLAHCLFVHDADLMVHPPPPQFRQLDEYQRAVQNLMAIMPPSPTKGDVRHPHKNKREDDLHIFKTPEGKEIAELCGIHHLVHKWTAQGHPHGVSIVCLVCVHAMLTYHQASIAFQSYDRPWNWHRCYSSAGLLHCQQYGHQPDG